MASITETQFIAEIQGRSSMLAALSSATLSGYIAQGLRLFSRRMPYKKYSADQAVVAGQEYYSLPTNCLEVVQVLESTTKANIAFQVKDEGSGLKLFLGSVYSSRMEDLMEGDYYDDFNNQSSVSVLTSYATFDIEYVVLQTITTLADTYLEVIADYVEYLAYKKLASDITMAMAQLTSDESVVRITDSDQGGNFVIEFEKPSVAKITMETMANEALQRFENALKFPFMIRG